MGRKDLSIAVFYTNATCNLKCKYCGIDKNKTLIEIDKQLTESFKNTQYYMDRVKKYFPHKDSLQRVETWGGEPFLGMERFYPLMHILIQEYPFLTEFFSSSNFSFPNWDEKVLDFLNQFNQYPNRIFNYNLQLSCDGPEHINDLGRGTGTTQKCLKNFDNFIQKIGNRLPPNVSLTLMLKPTLSLETLEFLKTKDDIIKYYQFFEENFIYKVKQLGFQNVDMGISIPNLAVPILATKKDGENFSYFCKMCREIEKENTENHYFNYYDCITPFAGTRRDNINISCHNAPCNACGSASNMIGIMPDNMISVCHEGFTEFLVAYKKEAANSPRLETGIIEFNKFIGTQGIVSCVTDEIYEDYERRSDYFKGFGAKSILASNTETIIALALANQIDKKYLNYNKALEAAIEFQERTPLCFKDNYNVTGSIDMSPIGMFRMFLNGAFDYICEKKEKRNV